MIGFKSEPNCPLRIRACKASADRKADDGGASRLPVQACLRQHGRIGTPPVHDQSRLRQERRRRWLGAFAGARLHQAERTLRQTGTEGRGLEVAPAN
jgi:hypothetical protein